VGQRAIFNKGMILDAAFALVRETGWTAVTARNIARKINSSTMPIYTSVRSMEDIEKELKARVFGLFQEYQKRPYTDNPMLNMAVGYVMFAKHEPNLFRFLYVERPDSVNFFDVLRQAEYLTQSFSSVPGVREQLAELPQGPQSPLVLNSWIYTHGLASMVSSGVLNLTDERIKSLLLEAGGAFYFYDRQRSQEENRE
jgi:AcrR family transcriptional regulator